MGKGPLKQSSSQRVFDPRAIPQRSFPEEVFGSFHHVIELFLVKLSNWINVWSRSRKQRCVGLCNLAVTQGQTRFETWSCNCSLRMQADGPLFPVCISMMEWSLQDRIGYYVLKMRLKILDQAICSREFEAETTSNMQPFRAKPRFKNKTLGKSIQGRHTTVPGKKTAFNDKTLGKAIQGRHPKYWMTALDRRPP